MFQTSEAPRRSPRTTGNRARARPSPAGSVAPPAVSESETSGKGKRGLAAPGTPARGVRRHPPDPPNKPGRARSAVAVDC
jgi:hypothetical protein